MSLMSRVARLEESSPDLGPEIVVVRDKAEAARVRAERGDNPRPVLCIITGVPRAKRADR